MFPNTISVLANLSWIFLGKKKWKNKISQKLNCTSKVFFQWLLKRQMRKRMRKLQPRFLKILGGDRVWKIPENHRFLWIKSVLWIFRKKNFWEKILFIIKCYTTCQSLGSIASQTKKVEKNSRNRMGPFHQSDMLLLTP